jgi:hypothetical protein
MLLRWLRALGIARWQLRLLSARLRLLQTLLFGSFLLLLLNLPRLLKALLWLLGVVLLRGQRALGGVVRRLLRLLSVGLLLLRLALPVLLLLLLL